LSKDIDVSYHFASMTGEKNFKNGSETEKNPEDERCVVKFSIPDEFYKEHFVREKTGDLSEVSFDCSIPAHFIVSHKIGQK